jgi:plastocyanin domain-containing protein
MFLVKKISKSITILGLALGFVITNPAQAEVKVTNFTALEIKKEFQDIEQPLWLKSIVTTSTLGLVSLELWWFLISKPK